MQNFTTCTNYSKNLSKKIIIYSEKDSPLHDFQMIFEKKIDHSERWRNSGHQSTLSYLLFLPFTLQMEIEWLNFVSTVYRLGQ